MVAIIRANADPICATSRPWFNTACTRANILANSGAVQPYQHLCGYNNYLNIALGADIFNTGGNNMSCCYTVPRFNITSTAGFANYNRELFRINLSNLSNDSYNFSSAIPQIVDIYGNGSYNFSNYGCGCNDYFGYDIGYYGYGYPVSYYGKAGSVNGNGSATAWSRKGYANSNQYGSTIVNNTRSGSKNYNLGVLGSYASGGGNKAWNFLGGLLSYAKSGGNKSVDASNLVNTALSSLFETGIEYFC